MVFLLLLIPAGLAIYAFVVDLKAYKIKDERSIFFTGSNGSGKSLIATTLVRKKHRKALLYVFFHNLLSRKDRLPVPYIYSNIPLRSKYYRPLLAEHLLKEKPIVENSIVFVDEFGGAVADQYSFTSYALTVQLTEFARYFRHWFNGYFIITDQTEDSVPKPIRDRMSCQYALSNCRRWFIKNRRIDVHPVRHVTCDLTQDEQKPAKETDQHYKSEYIIIHLPLFSRKRFYDTRCYSETYKDGFTFDPNYVPNGLKTRYYLDVNPAPDMDKLAKTDKKQLLRTIYSAKMKDDS